jgi:tetratricopeptide (TPR) repeat protein
MLLFFLLIIYCNGQDQEIRDGDAAFIKLKYDDAIKFYTNAINLDPGNVRAYYKRATVHQQRRSFREAMSDLNEVVQLDPDYHLVFHFFRISFDFPWLIVRPF